MGFYKKTLKDTDVSGKAILLRADYNVPVNEHGVITDDYRITQSLPTLQYLKDKYCRIIICSHLGRPKNKGDKLCSLRGVAKRLEKLLGAPVQFANDCVGTDVQEQAKKLNTGEILLLENLRFYPEEEKNDKEFAQKLASLADIFVQDGFGVVHRAHASTDAITHYLPSVGGLLLEKEVGTITDVMENPQRPLMAIIGGAKISDKIDILKKFIDIADIVAVGGAMANTFLSAEGIKVGSSLHEPEEEHLARQIIESARLKSKKDRFIFYLPQDGVVARKLDKLASTRIVDWGAHVIADIENYPKRPPRKAYNINADEKILDIGPFSGAFISGSMQLASTVVWNGAMGVTEIPSTNDPVGPFSHGSELVTEAILGQFGHKPFSLIGGGDTVGYLQSRGHIDYFDHVSTGGGASLELMAGKKLPGVEALMDKDGD